MRRYLPFVIIGIVLVAFATGGVLLFRAKSPTNAKIASGVPGAEPAHIRGGAQAQVTLEEFGDFQCPPCGILSQTLLKIEHDYGDKIRVIFREFPLAMHVYAMTAASAAEAAGLQNRFWEMHDLLFEHALFWAKDAPKPPAPVSDDEAARITGIFTEYATRIGLDVERYKKDIEGAKVFDRIKADQARGSSMGVDRTPVLYIDGVKIPFASFNVEDLKKIIDDALAGKPPEPETPSPSPTASPEP